MCYLCSLEAISGIHYEQASYFGLRATFVACFVWWFGLQFDQPSMELALYLNVNQ